MKFPAVEFPVNSLRHILTFASVFAIGACASAGIFIVTIPASCSPRLMQLRFGRPAP